MQLHLALIVAVIAFYAFTLEDYRKIPDPVSVCVVFMFCT